MEFEETFAAACRHELRVDGTATPLTPRFAEVAVAPEMSVSPGPAPGVM